MTGIVCWHYTANGQRVRRRSAWEPSTGGIPKAYRLLSFEPTYTTPFATVNEDWVDAPVVALRRRLPVAASRAFTSSPPTTGEPLAIALIAPWLPSYGCGTVFELQS
jgi:hypothetical protein